jgi:hypothetical protein
MSIEVRGGGGLRLEFEPARGGIITSLPGVGIEWLAQGDGRSVPPVGTAFVEAEMSGWDECAPSIISCEVNSYSIPDHGDIWDSEFKMQGTVAKIAGKSYPYLLERQISATPSGILISYKAFATEANIPFLWAAHPQFSAPPGTRVVIEGTTSVVDVLETPNQLRIWDDSISSIDSVPLGECRKYYIEPEHVSTKAELIRGEASLNLTWASTCSFLGVWFDHNAFSREPVIAIEPSTGYFDSLKVAVDNGLVATLVPGQPLTWWIEISASRLA